MGRVPKDAGGLEATRGRKTRVLSAAIAGGLLAGLALAGPAHAGLTSPSPAGVYPIPQNEYFVRIPLLWSYPSPPGCYPQTVQITHRWIVPGFSEATNGGGTINGPHSPTTLDAGSIGTYTSKTYWACIIDGPPIGGPGGDYGLNDQPLETISYTVCKAPACPKSGGGPLAGVTAWVQNIIEQMKTKYDPCDAGAIAAGTQSADCGQQGFRRNPQFWKATGSLVCATEVAHSYSGPFTPITTGGATQKCIKEFGPGGERSLRHSHRAGHLKPAQAKAGSYRGISISLASLGQPPTKKRLRQRGRALAAFLRSHKKPRNALPISFEVSKHGRAATFSPRLSLSCEDGSSLPVDLTDLPDPSAPLSVSRQGYFKLAAEDPVVKALIGGLFLNKRSLAGTFYLGVRIHQHGLCEALVGYAARRKA